MTTVFLDMCKKYYWCVIWKRWVFTTASKEEAEVDTWTSCGKPFHLLFRKHLKHNHQILLNESRTRTDKRWPHSLLATQGWFQQKSLRRDIPIQQFTHQQNYFKDVMLGYISCYNATSLCWKPDLIEIQSRNVSIQTFFCISSKSENAEG